MKGIFHHKERFSLLCSLLRVEPAQRMTVTELLEHQWLNEGTVPDVPLDTPSIIVSDEVCHSESMVHDAKENHGQKWPREILGARSVLLFLGLRAVMFSSRFICERTRRTKRNVLTVDV